MLYLALLKAVLPAESIKNAFAPNTPAHLRLSVKVALIQVNIHTNGKSVYQIGICSAKLGYFLFDWVKMVWVACDDFTIWAVCQMKNEATF